MKHKLFDLSLLDAGAEPAIPVEKSGAHAEQFLDAHLAMVESLKKLLGRVPRPGEIFFLWTVKSFNAFTFIPYIIRHHGVVHELVLATYSINIRIIDALVRLIDKQQIGSVDIFISDSIRTRLPKVYDHLMALSETKPVRVRYAWNHAKIALIRTDDHHFVVEGSGNWGENAQHEQYIFLDSPAVFDFRKQQITHAINATAT